MISFLATCVLLSIVPVGTVVTLGHWLTRGYVYEMGTSAVVREMDRALIALATLLNYASLGTFMAREMFAGATNVVLLRHPTPSPLAFDPFARFMGLVSLALRTKARMSGHVARALIVETLGRSVPPPTEEHPAPPPGGSPGPSPPPPSEAEPDASPLDWFNEEDEADDEPEAEPASVE